jgi:y4mF family transcriptional regulator
MHIIYNNKLHLYVNAYIKMNTIADFLKTRRKQINLTQEEFANKAGVALTVIRKIEQGKENLSLQKVNQVLQMFGHIVGPIKAK